MLPMNHFDYSQKIVVDADKAPLTVDVEVPSTKPLVINKLSLATKLAILLAFVDTLFVGYAACALTRYAFNPYPDTFWRCFNATTAVVAVLLLVVHFVAAVRLILASRRLVARLARLRLNLVTFSWLASLAVGICILSIPKLFPDFDLPTYEISYPMQGLEYRMFRELWHLGNVKVVCGCFVVSIYHYIQLKMVASVVMNLEDLPEPKLIRYI